MPAHNHFRHQTYDASPPEAPYELIAPERPAPPGSAEYVEQLSAAAEVLVGSGVTAVYLMHGTFAGTDSLGWIGELERAIPGVGRGLKRQHKRMVDALTGDQGNYVEPYREMFEQALRTVAGRSIPVRLFHWSSQNHHCARAEAAVMLIDALLHGPRNDGGRVLLWGHSHAGNVLALLTNLLGADVATRRVFFQAMRPYAEGSSQRATRTVWSRLQATFDKPGNPLAPLVLDIATYGTPIRYGWDSLGYGHLMHVVHHVPQEGLPPHQACFPRTIEQLRAAAAGHYGDYIQQTFVAGTNWPPPLTNWHAWRSDRLLSQLVQRDHPNKDLLKRLRAGRRVPSEGFTWLVDYAHADPEAAHAMSGHAVYTNLWWLPFHAQQMAKLYCGQADGAEQATTGRGIPDQG